MAHKVLIIDDEEGLRLVLMLRLEKMGYEVFQAADGLEGLEIAKKENPDIVVLDIKMPVMNGYETWRRFRAEDRLKKIPILILTCERQSNDRFWGASMAASDFITKPYDESQLVKRIEEMIRESKKKLKK
ncbi:MAG: response regulator [Deltaproteobacteria bacterium]|nr:response regulator [Deltaproteobacteria bacterium]